MAVSTSPGYTPIAQWNAGQTSTVQGGQDTYTNYNYADPTQINQGLASVAGGLGYTGGDFEQWLNSNGYGEGVSFGPGGLNSAILSPTGTPLAQHISADTAGAYFGGSALAGAGAGGGAAAGVGAGAGAGAGTTGAAGLDLSGITYGGAAAGTGGASLTGGTLGGGMAATEGAAAASGGGGLTSLLSSLTGGGGGAGSSAGGWLQALSSIYGLYQGNQLQKMGAAADPFAAYRGGFAQQLQQLMQNPSSVTSMPGYKASQDAAEQALTRNMASQGLTGSGTAASALATEGAQFQNNYFQQMIQTLSGLSGANMNNANLSLGAYSAGANTQNQSLQNLVKIMPALTGSGG
jgi:hypothetical protein